MISKKSILLTLLSFFIVTTAFCGVSSNLDKSFSPWIDATGGPDAYGYMWADSDEDSVDYEWIDITTIGTEVTGLTDDNFVGPFSIGFDFMYYWYQIEEVYIGSNGYLKIPPSYNMSQTFPATIPLSTVPNDFIAAYTMDLIFGAGQGQCFYYTNSVDQFIVSFIDVPCWATPQNIGTHTFQVIMDGTDNSIKVNFGYQEGIASNNDILIGLENNNGQVGLLHSADTYMPSDFAIKYYRPETTAYEVHDLSVDDVLSAGSIGIFAIRDEVYVPTGWVKNVGNQAELGTNVRCRITDALGTVVYEETVLCDDLEPGEVQAIDFGDGWTASATGNYSVTLVHNLPGDMNTANNTKTAELVVAESPGELSFDDGLSEAGQAWNMEDGAYAVFFDAPGEGAAEINNVRYFISSVASPPATFNARIYDADGPNSTPNTLIFEELVDCSAGDQWYLVDLSGAPVVDEDGIFYVAWAQTSVSNVYMGLDQTAPISRNTWEGGGGGWSPYRENETSEAMIRCMVGEGAIPEPIIDCTPDTVEFEDTVVGDTTYFDLTVANIGAAGDLILNTIIFNGVPLNLVYVVEGFTQGMAIAPGEEAILSIRFTPPTPMLWQSDMEIGSNASNGDAHVQCIGTGLPSVSVGDTPENSPVTFELRQNTPNPFNPVTFIEYSIPQNGNVQLTVYNSLGEEITRLVDGQVSAGHHTAVFDGASLGSGIYFYRITTEGFTQMKKMVLMK